MNVYNGDAEAPRDDQDISRDLLCVSAPLCARIRSYKDCRFLRNSLPSKRSTNTRPSSWLRNSPMGWRSAHTNYSAAGGSRIALVALLACVVDAFAAHPPFTEDAGTQGAGKFELELGNARTRDHADRVYEVGAQLSYGVLP